ncbi:ABC transporter ATP-binding protein [Kitasatospora azatica]|uniref:ABC transporter ATP-binding protein n=1 Tax=Kitasatospora azatica TaxID=58347 RepID=UPI00068A4AB6|nr:ABC transporter ATP-binding protein [Kitasatospora azatica]
MPATPGGRLLAATAIRLRPRLILLTAALGTQVAAGLALPVLLARAVDAVLRHGDTLGPVAALAAVLAAGAIGETGTLQLSVSTNAHGTAWLRMLTVRRLLGLGPRSPFPVGEAVTQVVQAAPQAAALPGQAAESAVSTAGSAVALVALWTVDWRAGLVFTLLFPLTALVARRFITEAGEAEARYLAAQTGMATLLVNALAGARTIRAVGTLAVETERVVAPLSELSAAGRAMWRLQRDVVWKLGLLMPLTQVLVLATAGLDLVAGRISPGSLLAVTGYLTLASGLLDQVDVLIGLASARAGASRLGEVLDQPVVEGGPLRTPPPSGALSLRGVTVHRSGTAVLDRLDLDIPDGASVALVGATGSGKSLLAALPGRLADPDEGEVLLGGVPVAELDLHTLHEAVAYAFERPALPGATLHEAIAFGRPELPRHAVEDAARAAQADQFVRRLPDGYDTAPDRAPMSGGQLQRVGLARALARPALLHVLDDATSGLDTVTETLVSEAVTERLGGSTRLIVTHRPTTAARCDLVAWLHDGRIRGFAPHLALWADPAYRAVFADATDPADHEFHGKEQRCAADR